MEKEKKKRRVNSSKALIVSITMFFIVLGSVVFSVSRRITSEMSESAIGNLSESLDLIRGTIETMLQMEAEYQKLMAQELSESEDLEQFIRFYDRNKIMTKVSVTESGVSEGLSSTGEAFDANELDFSAGKSVEDAVFSVLSEQYGDLGLYHGMSGVGGWERDETALRGICV